MADSKPTTLVGVSAKARAACHEAVDSDCDERWPVSMGDA